MAHIHLEARYFLFSLSLRLLLEESTRVLPPAFFACLFVSSLLPVLSEAGGPKAPTRRERHPNPTTHSMPQVQTSFAALELVSGVTLELHSELVIVVRSEVEASPYPCSVGVQPVELVEPNEED